MLSGPEPLLGAISGSMVRKQLGSVLMSVAYATSGSRRSHVIKPEGHDESALPLAGP